jgi:hypothetical protein
MSHGRRAGCRVIRALATLRRPVAAPGRSGWIAILVLAGVLACLGLITNLALQVAHQNDTINKLHAAAKNACQPAPATAAPPTIEAIVAYTLPSGAIS